MAWISNRKQKIIVFLGLLFLLLLIFIGYQKFKNPSSLESVGHIQEEPSASKVEGELNLDGQLINLGHGIARLEENAFSHDKKDLVLYLSENKLIEYGLDVFLAQKEQVPTAVMLSLDENLKPIYLVLFYKTLPSLQLSGDIELDVNVDREEMKSGRLIISFNQKIQNSLGHEVHLRAKANLSVVGLVEWVDKIEANKREALRSCKTRDCIEANLFLGFEEQKCSTFDSIKEDPDDTNDLGFYCRSYLSFLKATHRSEDICSDQFILSDEIEKEIHQELGWKVLWKHIPSDIRHGIELVPNETYNFMGGSFWSLEAYHYTVPMSADQGFLQMSALFCNGIREPKHSIPYAVALFESSSAGDNKLVYFKYLEKDPLSDEHPVLRQLPNIYAGAVIVKVRSPIFSDFNEDGREDFAFVGTRDFGRLHELFVCLQGSGSECNLMKFQIFENVEVEWGVSDASTGKLKIEKSGKNELLYELKLAGKEKTMKFKIDQNQLKKL